MKQGLLAPMSLALAGAALTLSVALVACRGQEQQAAPNCTETSQAPAIDNEVMAFLSGARARHHVADLKEDASDLAGAADEMEKLVAMPKPHPNMVVVEVEEVLADAYARLAELRLRLGDKAAASRSVGKSLEHADAPTYFRGHALEVKGLIDSAAYKELLAAGKTAEAEEARQRAMDALDQAAQVQYQVIFKKLPGDAGDREGGR